MTMEVAMKPREKELTIDGLLEGFLSPRAPFAPAVDIRETDDAIELHCDLPGVEKQDVQIEVRDKTLVLAGVRKPRKEEGGWLRQECASGSFYRAFALPAEVEAGRVSAAMSDGVLEVRLPKAEQAKPHRVQVALSAPPSPALRSRRGGGVVERADARSGRWRL